MFYLLAPSFTADPGINQRQGLAIFPTSWLQVEVRDDSSWAHCQVALRQVMASWLDTLPALHTWCADFCTGGGEKLPVPEVYVQYLRL
ncbi:hypothetical protein RRG08_013110 [Elysia crispata]|uniref:Uncharacterized protein n=1 Tax=Elysia crispata TaxID=231223 RepID=A0AAE1DQ72_9GAST|nr:hypothetical protein RRG08_013110 [Elysia crispata]